MGFIVSLFVIYEFRIIAPGDVTIETTTILTASGVIVTAGGVILGGVAILIAIFAYFGFNEIKEMAIKRVELELEDGKRIDKLIEKQVGEKMYSNVERPDRVWDDLTNPDGEDQQS